MYWRSRVADAGGDPPDRVCPDCGVPSDAGREACAHCGTSLQ